MALQRLTGLQKQSVKLYRVILRAIRQKPLDSQEGFKEMARTEFEKYRAVSPKNFQLLEHLHRKGQKKLEMLRQSELTAVSKCNSPSS
mmetsp:Transcript_22224/g.39551  ORF Transcript_22224/g.39551 Transcript_22224/m.39551 type:complete len:88 (-) Transcript_22224:277-540(-)